MTPRAHRDGDVERDARRRKKSTILLQLLEYGRLGNDKEVLQRC